jgi:hypothetical protein
MNGNWNEMKGRRKWRLWSPAAVRTGWLLRRWKEEEAEGGGVFVPHINYS